MVIQFTLLSFCELLQPHFVTVTSCGVPDWSQTTFHSSILLILHMRKLKENLSGLEPLAFEWEKGDQPQTQTLAAPEFSG